jgi:probable H4MPT-linked C1 transfer pathway protein
VLGLDVGGATLKLAHWPERVAVNRPFALWKDPAGLAAVLAEALRDPSLPPFDLVAVTMTGELCDCFETKREGVRAILDAVEAAAGAVPVRVWLTGGLLVDPAEARREPLPAAASNWLALATFAGRAYAPTGPALLLDVGSTTTDVVPLLDGLPVPRGRTDPERLACGELVYTGVGRTPLCALLGAGHAAELFATTLDVYLTLGRVAERPDDHGTADGRPATRQWARDRLARMRCADRDTCTEDETRALAERAEAAQRELVLDGVRRVTAGRPGPVRTVVVSGSGEFLARAVAAAACPGALVRSLAQELGPGLSQAACAYALAVLAAGV